MTKKQISENECLRLLVCLISFVVFVCFVADETIEIKLQLIMLRHRSDPEGSDPSLKVAVVLISPSANYSVVADLFCASDSLKSDFSSECIGFVYTYSDIFIAIISYKR